MCKKELKLMPDYDCYPLWVRDDAGLENIDPNSLNIPASLKQSLEIWKKEYDSTYVRNNPIESGFKSMSDEKKYYEEGKKLYYELLKELGHAYKVYYLTWSEDQ
jgi:hypothetical protein